MSMRNDNPLRFNWRTHPRPSSRHEEQPPADAGEEMGGGQLFQGMRFDPETDHFFERTRAFDPKVQRWANQEPLAYVDGLNVYTACANNPINAVNPLGL